MKNKFDFQPKLFTALRNYSKERFMTDLMAGIIVGIVALPLAIAFGIASGVSPEKGLITAIIGGFIVSLLGGCNVQIGGPTGAFIVIVYGIIQNFGIEGLAIATVIAGIILVLMGVLKLGTVIKFIPYPIVVGFTSGIAITIFTTQMKDLFGLTMDKVPADFISKWIAYFGAFDTVNPWAFVIGIISILIITLSPRLTKKIPGSLIAIVIMTIVVYIMRNHLGITGIETIGDRFTINASLPAPAPITFNMETINLLLPSAFTIASLGAIARTMTNINNGGRTPVAGIIHAIVLLLILLFLGPLTKHIPMACLAGVLIIVSYNMSEWRTFRSLMKNPKSDVSVLLVTFFLTVIFDLTIAIEIGLLIAMLFFMRRVAETTHVSVTTDEIDLSDEGEIHHDEEVLSLPKGVEVYEIDGPFFFGVANKFDGIMKSMGDKPKVRIIRMRKVSFIDSTGLHNLESLFRLSEAEHIHMILSGVNEHVHRVLTKSGFDKKIGAENICSNINEAVEKAKAGNPDLQGLAHIILEIQNT